MTKDKQKEIVTELYDRMKAEIYKSIEDGRIPETWDGIELRWLVADKANSNIAFPRPALRRRKSEYNNYAHINHII